MPHVFHFSPKLLGLLAFALLLLLTANVVAGLEYGFSDENPTVCFVEEVTESERKNEKGKIEHYVVGSYTWKPHAKNAGSRFTMSLKNPNEQVLGSSVLEANADGSPKPFAFKAEVDLPGPHVLCVSLHESAGILADKPIFISFDVDQADDESMLTRGGRNNLNENEEVVMALRAQYRRKRWDTEQGIATKDEPTREVVDGKEVFVYQEYGGQVKSILRSPEDLKELSTALNKLDMEVRRKTGLLSEMLESEGRMRATSESTFNRVWGCAVVVMMATAVVVTWQFSLLKTTLKRKKKV